MCDEAYKSDRAVQFTFQEKNVITPVREMHFQAYDIIMENYLLFTRSWFNCQFLLDSKPLFLCV
jgi:hypothetical protein